MSASLSLSPSSMLRRDWAPLYLTGLPASAFFFLFFLFLVFLLLRNGTMLCLPNPAAACRPSDKKRRPTAPCSGRGGGAGRPGHPRPVALRLCWAGYRWCPSKGLSRRLEARRGRLGRGSGGRGGDRGAANRRAAHQLTAFAYTRCTPAAGSTKRGAPRAPAASRRARRGPCARACSALRVGRGAGGVSPGGGIRAVASLVAPGAFFGTWPLSASPSAPHFSCPPPQSCLLLPRPPRVGLSPGPRSSCCSCRCLASCLGALLGAPRGASTRCGLGGRRRSAGSPPPPPAAAAGPCAPHNPASRASG